ncbi:MAG: hypothetical protein PHU86_03900 [Patescibacteria group bacterium]|nr:hypothetical protein [Patescibacteria group bacterium]
MTKNIEQDKLNIVIKECQDFFGQKNNVTPKIIFVYSREEMDKALGRKTQDWVRASTRPEGLYFIHPSKVEELTPHKNDDFWKVVKHEMSHWFYNQITGTHNGEPRWLAEGLAMFMAEQKGLVPSFTEESITQKYYSFTDNETYRWGYLMVKDLVDEFGKEKVVSLVKKINNKLTEGIFSELFKNEFGVSLSAFEKKVKRHYFKLR